MNYTVLQSTISLEAARVLLVEARGASIVEAAQRLADVLPQRARRVDGG